MSRAAAVALLLPVLLAAKKYDHGLGFGFDLPNGWRAEDARAGVMLFPKGVAVDPNREDNPEVYSVWAPDQEGSSETEYIAGLRAFFRGSKIGVDREGDVEAFSFPGKPGVMYTFDFAHPRDGSPQRVRIFAVTSNGRPLLLIAKGRRERLNARDKDLRAVGKSLEWRK